MSGKRPRLTLWIDDFEAHLFRSAEPTVATGARIRLWCRAYRTGGTLPADDAKLARWAGLSLDEWQTAKPFLEESWERVGDEYVLRRVREELGFREFASERAKAAADSRWSEEECAEHPSSNATSMLDASSKHATPMLDASAKQCLGDALHPTPSLPFPSLSSPELDSLRESRPSAGEGPVEPPGEKREETGIPEAEIEQVYAHYLHAMGLSKSQYSLTKQRRAKIRTRLTEWNPRKLCEAIDRCRASPFHMGQNDRGTLYNDLAEHILHSTEKVERWLNGQLGGRNGTH